MIVKFKSCWSKKWSTLWFNKQYLEHHTFTSQFNDAILHSVYLLCMRKFQVKQNWKTLKKYFLWDHSWHLYPGLKPGSLAYVLHSLHGLTPDDQNVKFSKKCEMLMKNLNTENFTCHESYLGYRIGPVHHQVPHLFPEKTGPKCLWHPFLRPLPFWGHCWLVRVNFVTDDTWGHGGFWENALTLLWQVDLHKAAVISRNFIYTECSHWREFVTQNAVVMLFRNDIVLLTSELTFKRTTQLHFWLTPIICRQPVHWQATGSF